MKAISDIEKRKRKIKALLNTKKPYDNKDFNNVGIDKDSLISMDALEFTPISYFKKISGTLKQHPDNAWETRPGSFRLKDKNYALCFPHENYFTLVELGKLFIEEKICPKVRLDPFDICSPVILKAYVFGHKLNWDEIEETNEDKYTVCNSYDEKITTHFFWKYREDNVIFKCEELPPKELLGIRGSKFFHAIYNKDSKKITHCDGAKRFFNENDFPNPEERYLKISNKIGEKIKIFKIDENISRDKFSSLVLSFFYWNLDVNKYFKNL